ncbi:MAG: PHP domain-containing protein [Muribaculaceae bacterium]|nr:PHP domain-containing protein [Muribaculaceae bacterium]
MRQVDLHVHSNRSDGTYTPSELVDYALEKGLLAFALTDHDTTAGIEEALSYAENKPIEVIPGIEFSTEYEGKDVHVVGLYIHYDTPSFQAKLQSFVDSRIQRNQKMCENLQGAGIDITYEKLCEEMPEAVITRSHYAAYLVNHGYVASRADAFAKYIGDHCKYFVPREKVTPSQAVELILQAGGAPILAHPPLYHMSDDRLETLVAKLSQDGLMGIETIYSTYSNQEERDMFRLAKKYALLPSGGSDFHGGNKPGLDLAVGYGKLFVPESILQGIQERLKSVD